MKAKVQYNDYQGTTAADRSDLFVEFPDQMERYIIDKFEIPLDPDRFHFIGISVYGTIVDAMGAYFFFGDRLTKEVYKYHKDNICFQGILDLFKRFSLQIGKRLNEIDESNILEVENPENR